MRVSAVNNFGIVEKSSAYQTRGWSLNPGLGNINDHQLSAFIAIEHEGYSTLLAVEVCQLSYK